MQTVISSQQLTVTINHFGAEVCSIINNSKTEFIWQAENEWQKHAPVLFPIVGKLKNDYFQYEEKIYNLSQHGFARNIIFNLISSTENSCTFELLSSLETKNNYPFDFIFQINYEVIKNKLFVIYTVSNPSPHQLYFSLGAHPAFSCQLNGNDTIGDYYLKFEKSDFMLSELNSGLRTINKSNFNISKNKLLLSTDLFNNDALIFENSQINKISLCSLAGNQKITLECNNWPYFGIWSKQNCNKFICLEPWYGIADSELSDGDFKSKQGIISLEQFKFFLCKYSITIS